MSTKRNVSMTKKIIGTTLLLTGSNKDYREEESKKIASSYSSKFDTYIIDAQEENGINNVREIIKTASRKPFESQLISIIILEAHRLTTEAQNAMLKLLEEPGNNCQIILTAPTKDSLLPTVASRLLERVLKQPKSNYLENFKTLNFSELSLSERLQLIEKSTREDYLDYWSNKLKENTLAKKDNLRLVHRYNKLLIKMIKAQKKSVNKRLIDLILALEMPQVK